MNSARGYVLPATTTVITHAVEHAGTGAVKLCTAMRTVHLLQLSVGVLVDKTRPNASLFVLLPLDYDLVLHFLKHWGVLSLLRN